MKYPAYPQYKDSGVAWLGEVPGHWEVKRIKFVFPKLHSGVSVNSENTPASCDAFGILKTSCVYGNRFIPGENKQILEEEIQRVSCPVTADSLIISRMNTPELVGNCGYVQSSHPNLFLPDRLWIARFSGHKHMLGKFAWYLTSCDLFAKLTAALATGTSGSMKNLSQEAFLNIDISFPKYIEQTAIADFLDRETGRIDTLVAKKRKLVELLKEKRSALISRTVTRGLPADVSREFGLAPHSNFKPVGIECLTEIPETWTEKKLKHLGDITPGFAFNSADFESSGIRVLKISNIQTGKLDWSDDSYIPEELYEKHKFFVVKDGDVVFALTRPIISTGLKAAVARVGEEKILLNQRNARFRPYKGFNYGFLYYTLFSNYFIAEFEMCIDATGQQPNISTIDIANIEIVTPPYSEQTAIAAYLDRETAKIDRLVAKVETAIARLQEYRSALITAAVTGKIDVREA